MEYLEQHPVLSRDLEVWATCPSCRHYTKLVQGYYCRCGYDGWSACQCKAMANRPVPRFESEPQPIGAARAA